MGLDMYMWGEKKYSFLTKRPTEDGFELRSRTLDLGYWRNRPKLHECISALVEGANKGHPTELSLQVLRKILKAAKDGKLTEADRSKIDEYTVEIFAKAIEWAANDVPDQERRVYYQATGAT